MRHVLWIGGAPGSGKTTVATRLARRHGLRWYNADARTWAHRDRALRDGNEAAQRWEAWRWLIPTRKLQHARLTERDGNANDLYLLLAAEIEREVREHGAPILMIDGSRTIDDTVAAVEELFADALALGPRAETPAERRALLREGNLAQVEQIRAYYARPWAGGDAETIERMFICECGDPTCDASVVRAVGAVAAEPALAAGHD